MMKRILQNLLLVCLGFFLFVLLLESGLRLTGVTRSFIKEYGNQTAVKEKKDFVILCVGESTTDRQWPVHLGEYLHRERPDIQFIVVDKGKAGINSTQLVDELPQHIQKYNPDMIASMMGVNDGIGHYKKIIAPSANPVFNMIKKLKVFRLMQLSFLHIRSALINASTKTKARMEKAGESNESQSAYAEAQTFSRKCRDAHEYFDCVLPYIKQKRIQRSIILLENAPQEFKNDESIYFSLGTLYLEMGQHNRLYELLIRAHTLFSKDILRKKHPFDLQTVLVAHFIGKKEIEKAKTLLSYVEELAPEHLHVLRLKAEIYKIQGEYARAEKILLFTLQQKKTLYGELALVDVLILQNRFQEAEALLAEIKGRRGGLEDIYSIKGSDSALFHDDEMAEHIAARMFGVDVRRYLARNKLAVYYAENNNSQGFNSLFSQDSNVDSVQGEFDTESQLLLAQAYLHAGYPQKAQNIYVEHMDLDQVNENILAGLAMSYFLKEEYETAHLYFNELNELRLEKINEVVYANYKEMVNIARDAGCQLVCVQYPMRDVDQLKAVLGQSDDIIFVDNEDLFKQAVMRDGYDAYFGDNFAIDFGHCTEKGNRLLAENIAQTIIREYFKK